MWFQKLIASEHILIVSECFWLEVSQCDIFRKLRDTTYIIIENAYINQLVLFLVYNVSNAKNAHIA